MQDFSYLYNMKKINKYLFTTCCLVFITSYSYTQNLVTNPSFEDTVHCPTTIGQLIYAKFWNNPTQGTPDYYNACSTANSNVVHVPNNAWGNQVAKSGVAYAGIYAFNKLYPDVREYIQTNLIAVLNPNHKYYVSFYVSLSDGAQYAISTIGACFSASPITSTNSVTLNYTPQIQNASSNKLTDKTNWMLIADTLYATGSEQFITIGNFRKDSLSDTLFLGNIGGPNVAYYYVDSVSVIDYGLAGIENYKNKVQVNIYPNPANEILNIETNEEQGEIKITDLLGNEIKNEKINKHLQIDVGNLSNGVYFVTFVSGNSIFTNKFVKE